MTREKEQTREELQAELEKAERKKKYFEQQEKILTRKVIPKLTHAERTNRVVSLDYIIESEMTPTAAVVIDIYL